MVRTAMLQKDVNMEEEVELRRLEASVPSDDEEEAGDNGAPAEALPEESDVAERDGAAAGALKSSLATSDRQEHNLACVRKMTAMVRVPCLRRMVLSSSLTYTARDGHKRSR